MTAKKIIQRIRQYISPATNRATAYSRRLFFKLFLPELRRANGIKYAHDGELEDADSACERWIKWSGVLVVIAVIAEFAIAISHPPYDSFCERWGSALSDLFILVGISGEVVFGLSAGRIQTELRKRSNDKLGEANERAANADLRRVELEEKLAARSLTKEQFEILKKLKGMVPELIIASEKGAEPEWFATVLAQALANIGIKVWLMTRKAGISGTANFVCDKRAFVNPGGEPTKGEPLKSILTEAGIPIPGVSSSYPADLFPDPADDPDVPLIVIGGRFVVGPKPPYLGEGVTAPHPTMVERMRDP